MPCSITDRRSCCGTPVSRECRHLATEMGITVIRRISGIAEAELLIRLWACPLGRPHAHRPQRPDQSARHRLNNVALAFIDRHSQANPSAGAERCDL